MKASLTNESFRILKEFKSDNSGSNYNSETFGIAIREPFKRLRDAIYPGLRNQLPEYGLTDKSIMSQHANRSNQLYHHFWGAFYRSAYEKKSNDLQLFFYIEPNQFKFGIYLGEYIDRELFLRIHSQLVQTSKMKQLISQISFEKPLNISVDNASGFLLNKLSIDDLNPSNREVARKGVNLYFSLSPSETVKLGEGLSEKVAEGFKQLIPIYKYLLEKEYSGIKAIGLNGPKTWIVAAGEDSEKWPMFNDEGIVAIGWDALVADLSKLKSESEIRSNLQAAYNTQSNKMNDTKCCFEFAHVMKPGDVVYVKDGLKGLLAKGIITGEYSYQIERGTYRHVRKVDWLVDVGPLIGPSDTSVKILQS